MSSLGLLAFCIVINHFILGPVSLPSFNVYFKNGPESLPRENCSGIYFFDEISAPEFGFEKCSYTSNKIL